MISIIIPTYKKDAVELQIFLHALTIREGAFEIIVSDYGTPGLQDLIENLADRCKDKVRLRGLSYDASDGRILRSRAMNEGAAMASGEIVLFLHSDTILPDNAISLIESVLCDSECVGGGFLKEYDCKQSLLPLTEKILNWQTRCNREFVGTNAIFVRRDIFQQIRFNENFLEDVEFSDELIRRFGKDRLSVIPDYVSVSSIKYIQRGPVKAILINAIIMMMYRRYRIGHDVLAEFYHSKTNTSYSSIIKAALSIVRNRDRL